MSRDRGALAIEYVIVAPMLLLVFALIFAYGAVAQVNGTLDTGTRDAVRVATRARTYDEARGAAQRAVEQAVGESCDDLTVELTPAAFLPGDTMRVQATCRYHVPLLGLPITVRSQFQSVLDPNRGVG